MNQRQKAAVLKAYKVQTYMMEGKSFTAACKAAKTTPKTFRKGRRLSNKNQMPVRVRKQRGRYQIIERKEAPEKDYGILEEDEDYPPYEAYGWLEDEYGGMNGRCANGVTVADTYKQVARSLERMTDGHWKTWDNQQVRNYISQTFNGSFALQINPAKLREYQ